MTTTRRFFARPASDRLAAIGSLVPWPTIRAPDTPAHTVFARSRLKASALERDEIVAQARRRGLL